MQKELMSLFPSEREISRRTFVGASLCAGFAFAVHPIQVGTKIITDVNGLIAGEVKIQTSDGEVPAYRAAPATGNDFPVLLVVQEIFVSEDIKDICRRFAKAGYLAVATEMNAHISDAPLADNLPTVFKGGINPIAKIPDAQVMSDLDATVAWAKQNNGDISRLGITGFGWGGRSVWLYAAHNPNLKAGVAWYGRLAPPSPVNQRHPKYPLEIVKDLKAPVLGLYGDSDQGIPAGSIEQMQKALKEANNPSEIRTNLRKEQAQDGWMLSLAWLKKYGAA